MSSTSVLSSAQKPKKIRPLPKNVIDRIAAGEVVQRPASLVKELIENSLDADSTTIDVHCQKGGLDAISVTDDGVGISPRDLPLAATRFATSKLTEVEDLKSLKTFGFRGEALASASMVGRVTIVSRVRKKKGAVADLDDDDDDGAMHGNCAFRMHYRDGKPANENSCASSKVGSDSMPPKPRPSAGREGTTVQVQDLFYNIPSRRRAMEGRKNEREEYDKILSVVQRYAVHEAKSGVGFVCRGNAGGISAGGGGRGVGGKGSGKRGRSGLGGNHTDLNTQSLTSVKKLQEGRKKERINSLSKTATGSVSLKKQDKQIRKPQTSLEDEQFAATKEVIGHIFGSDVSRELLPLKAGEGDVDAVSLAALKALVEKPVLSSSEEGSNASLSNDREKQQYSTGQSSDSKTSDFNNEALLAEMMGENEQSQPTKNDKNPNSHNSHDSVPSKFAFAYKATGLITNGSFSAPKSSAAFLLFINDRLVESASLRRSVESIYSDTLPKGGKPFVYISLQLPGPHVDVNVHPTKREVAFLHEDRLCDAVAGAVKEVISSATSSRVFVAAAPGGLFLENDDEKGNRKMNANEGTNVEGLEQQKSTSETENQVPAKTDASMLVTTNSQSNEDELKGNDKKVELKTPNKRQADDVTMSSRAKRAYDPSRLVRTNLAAPAGALEPFLVKTSDIQSSQKEIDVDEATTAQDQTSETSQSFSHAPDCEFGGAQIKVDMSIPGAFASAICRCQVDNAQQLPPVTSGNQTSNRSNNNGNIVRPKKITPTDCNYESIRGLRNEIASGNHKGLNENLRGSTYVGAVSRSRSLIQSGIDLLMINHRELAQEMFYQIALLKFKGMPMASLGGGGVNVMTSIGQMLQFEEDLNSTCEKERISFCSKLSKTNTDLARQATSCLAEKAPMLEEYFSIKFEEGESCEPHQQGTNLHLTGLPILLDGHSPQPHALPLFLLRLATEVNWKQEKECFQSICKELGSFYAELPVLSNENESSSPLKKPAEEDRNSDPSFVDDEVKQYLKHCLFPGISHLLVPPKSFANNGNVVKLANLKSLYKVFERC